jgi:hypothetical protein
VSEGWDNSVVETKPIVSAPVLTVEAQTARMSQRASSRAPREDSPIFRRFSPRRSHWSEIVAYDERAQELERRAAALNDEIAQREQALKEAVATGRERLTEWQLGDRKRPRPEPTAPAIEREIEERKADRDAALAARDSVYEDKARYVQKNRKRLVHDADKATADAHARYVAALEAAERARTDLIDCRSSALWASLYPGELADQLPDVAAVAANLRKPVESVLQLKTRLPAEGVFRVLRSDAEVLAEAMTREQAVELGAADAQEGAAIWRDAPEGREQAKKEREEALARSRAMWGRDLA